MFIIPNKVYYINLDIELYKERNKHIKNELIKYYNSIIHFPAVYGKEKEQIDKAIKYLNMPITFKNECGLGAIGCTLSHLSVMKTFFDTSDEDYVFIFEDDAIFSDNYKEHLNNIVEYINNNNIEFELLQLGNQYHDDIIINDKYYIVNDNILLVNKTLFCAQAYIISKSGIKKLFNYIESINYKISTIDIIWLFAGINTLSIIERKTKDYINKDLYLIRSTGIIYQKILLNSIHLREDITQEDYNILLNENKQIYKRIFNSETDLNKKNDKNQKNDKNKIKSNIILRKKYKSKFFKKT